MKLVLDTNIVLDLFVFKDEAVAALHDQLVDRKVEWFATSPMREELACVLRYEQIGARMGAANVSAPQVLQSFDEHAQIVAVAASSKVTCRDADDQKFIDLAIERGATLLSKDKHVLSLRRKLAAMDVTVAKSL